MIGAKWPLVAMGLLRLSELDGGKKEMELRALARIAKAHEVAPAKLFSP
jgi:hypothetical protein